MRNWKMVDGEFRSRVKFVNPRPVRYNADLTVRLLRLLTVQIQTSFRSSRSATMAIETDKWGSIPEVVVAML